MPLFSFFSFIGGTFADRWRPKRTMVWCDILSAVSVSAVLITLVFATWKAVFFVTLVSAILSQFSQPSGMKLFKMHLPAKQMQAGMSIYQTTFSVFMILGPVLGTFVFQNFGINVAIVVMGVAFLLSAGALAFLPPDGMIDEGNSRMTLRQEMVSGIRYMLSSKVLTLLGICFMASGLGLGLIQPLYIFLVTERLGLPKESLQWLMAVNGTGMILGGVLAMIFAKTVTPQKLLVFGMLIGATGISISGFSTILLLTLSVQFIGGLALPCISIGINTIIMQKTESVFVGRVNGIFMLLYTGSVVLMMSMAGALKEQFSLVVIFEAAALLLIVGMLFIIPLYRFQV